MRKVLWKRCGTLVKIRKEFRLEKVKVKSLSRVRLFVTPWTVAHQAPLSMGFSRQEYWSGLPFPSPKMSVIQAREVKKIDLKILKVYSEKLARKWKVLTGSYK